MLSMNSETLLHLKRKRSSTVVEQIWTELRRMILRGKLAPGTRLVELDIAGQSGVSQASVRETLHRLERDGLVVRRGRRGTFVTEVEPEKMREIFHIRSTVEGFAMRSAMERMTPQRVTELEGLVDRMREAGRRGDIVEVVETDMELHHRICTWAEHPTLLRVWELLYTQLERYLMLYDVAHFADLTQVAEKHVPLLQAIRSGDPDAAAEVMRSHTLIGVPPSDLSAFLTPPRRQN
jgi:DNA-binding GntR family transcriptional regulator